jgi:hypothetical protein
MRSLNDIQYAELVDMTEPAAVFEEVKSNFIRYYAVNEFCQVRKAFGSFNRLYEGRYPGYGKCNTKYHDKLHTTDALLAMSRLIDGYNTHNKKFPVKFVKLALISTMFHDAGYIQKKSDHKGTGAKFTLNHVERSIEFLKEYLKVLGYNKADRKFAENMVHCTGLNVSVFRLSFRSREEKHLGLMLGTADLIGQMASRTYLERLTNLYKEFKEGRVAGYESAFDLLKKTIGFHAHMKVRLEKDLEDVQRYAKFHFNAKYKINKNLYLVAIGNHMVHLADALQSGSKRFMKNLRRKNVFK